MREVNVLYHDFLKGLDREEKVYPTEMMMFTLPMCISCDVL